MAAQGARVVTWSQKLVSSPFGRAELPPRWAPALLLSWRQELERAARELLASPGILAVAYPPDQRADVLAVVSLASRRLRRSCPVRWISFDEPDLGQLWEGVVFVEDAPLRPELHSWLSVRPGTTAVLLGAASDWAAVEVDAFSQRPNVRWYRVPRAEKPEPETEESEAAVPHPDLFPLVALADALGAPLPLEVAARACHVSPDEVLEWALDASTPAYLTPEDHVTTRSRAVAARSAAQLSDEQVHRLLDRLARAFALDRPEHRWAAVGIARGLVAAGRLSRARTLLEALVPALELGALGPPERLAWGVTCSRALAFSLAEAILGSGSQEPELAHARAVNLGRWAARDSQRVPQAREAFRELVNRFPDEVWPRQAWASFELDTGGDLVRAQAELTRLEGQSEPVVRVLRAQLLRRRGQLDLALEQLDSAPPENPYVRHLRAVVLADLGRLDEAETLLQTLLDEIPDHVPTLHALGTLAYDRGHLRRAERFLEQGLGRAPEHPFLLHTLAMVREEQGRSSEAAALLLRLQETVDPDNPHVLVALGVLEAKRGDLSAAAAWFDRAERRFPANPMVPLARAQALVRYAGRDPQVAASLQGALDRARRLAGDEWPPLLVAQARSAVAGEGPQAFGRAREHLRAALQRSPFHKDRVVVLNTWAELAEACGLPAEARERLSDALQLDPDNAFTLRAFGHHLARFPLTPEDSMKSQELLARAARWWDT